MGEDVYSVDFVRYLGNGTMAGDGVGGVESSGGNASLEQS